jgi:hypothetical protein
MLTLTTANSAFTLEVPSVFAAPIPMEGYAADDQFDTDSISPNEVLSGVDNKLSGGYVYVPVKLKFTLQADSPSIFYMDTWYQSMRSNSEAFTANATIVAPSVGKIWTFTKGFLTGYKPTPNAKKLMQPQVYEVTFQNYTSAAGAVTAALVA